jgi:hypothetical protein
MLIMTMENDQISRFVGSVYHGSTGLMVMTNGKSYVCKEIENTLGDFPRLFGGFCFNILMTFLLDLSSFF